VGWRSGRFGQHTVEQPFPIVLFSTREHPPMTDPKSLRVPKILTKSFPEILTTCR
jgi:hypothetical protein